MTMSAAARTRARPVSIAAWSRPERIDLGRPVGEPPQVGQRVGRVVGADDERGVLLACARA